MADPEVIYEGAYFHALTPHLYVDMDKDSRTFGWLMVKHPYEQWVTLADLKPLAARIGRRR